jgi:hypothetical protein
MAWGALRYLAPDETQHRKQARIRLLHHQELLRRQKHTVVFFGRFSDEKRPLDRSYQKR